MHLVVGSCFRIRAASFTCLVITSIVVLGAAGPSLAALGQAKATPGTCVKLQKKIGKLQLKKNRASAQNRRRIVKKISRLKRQYRDRCSVTTASDGFIASSHSVLAASLQREIAKTKKDFVFSPYSIHTALSMLYAGARKKTAAQIAAALGLDKDSAAKLPELQLELNQALFALTNGVELRNANMLYLDERLKPNPTFLNTLRTNYLAEVGPANFQSDPEAVRQRMNGKVEELTNQMIKDLFPEGSITERTRLALVNAVYLNAEWQYPFSAAHKDTFHAPGGDVKAMMMSVKSSYGYRSSPDYETVEIPNKGGTTSMYIVLPKAGSELSFTDGLSPQLLSSATSGLAKQSMLLTMPKFTIDTPLNTGKDTLEELLKKIGIRDAFTGRADFSGIAPRGLYVDQAVHKAKIKVTEKGTEAAAATGILMTTSRPREIVTVDRPFLFVIKHNPSGAILFQGFVSNPKP